VRFAGSLHGLAFAVVESEMDLYAYGMSISLTEADVEYLAKERE
jgi:hypothetical protein